MEERIAKIKAVLDTKKAEDIQTIYLDGHDYITDVVIIATSLNGRHGESLLNELKNTLKAQGETFIATDEENDEWIIADLGDIIIHIMTQSYREKYALENFLEDLKRDHLEA